MLIWDMLDFMYKLEGAEEKKRVIKHNSGDWIGTSRRLDEAPSDCTFRRELQNSNQEGSS